MLYVIYSSDIAIDCPSIYWFWLYNQNYIHNYIEQSNEWKIYARNIICPFSVGFDWNIYVMVK